MSFGYKDNFHFRPIAKEDEEIVRKIIFQVLGEYNLPLDIEGVDQDLFDIIHYYKNGLFGVIEETEQSKIIGSFALYPLSEKEIELRKMYLLKAYRNKGIGTWCIRFCEAFAQKAGYEYIVLESASVLTEAIGLYKKHGYENVERENEVSRCDIFMKKRIN